MKKSIRSALLVVVTMFAILAVGCESTTKTADVSESSYSVSSSDTSFYLKYFDSNDVYEKAKKVKHSDSCIDYWEITNIFKQEPVLIPGTETINLYIEEIGENGEISVVSYETSIVSKISKEVRDEWVNGVNWEETTNGKYILYRQYMQKYIVHYTNSGINLFPCDVNADCFLETQNGKVLIAGWHSLYVYDMKTQKSICISQEVLDGMRMSSGTMLFCDENHVEWKCNWSDTTKLQKTGRKVVSYIWEDNSKPVFYSDFQKTFLEMQKTVKADVNFEDKWGEEFESHFTGYKLLSSHIWKDDEFASIYVNIHLPKPYLWEDGFGLDYQGTSDYYDSVYYAAWWCSKNKLSLYRYGKELLSYNLPKGNWRLLDCDGGSERDLKSIKVLMLNLSNRSLYVLQNGKVKKIQSGLTDIEVIHGEVFWLDAKGRAYQMMWPKSFKNVLIEKKVLALDCNDGILVLIVSKNDPRATQDQRDKGYFIETIYGK